MELPSNSHTTKAQNEKQKNVEQLVTARVQKRKKSVGGQLASVFNIQNMGDVGRYILEDVLVPAVRDLVRDIIFGGVEKTLYGEPLQRRRTTSFSGGVLNQSPTRTNFGSMYRGPVQAQRGVGGRQISRSARSTHNFDEIIFDSRGDAEKALQGLVDLVDYYDAATVQDFYDIVGVTGEYTDKHWGWYDLSITKVARVRDGGYILELPATEPLK